MKMVVMLLLLPLLLMMIMMIKIVVIIVIINLYIKTVTYSVNIFIPCGLQKVYPRITTINHNITSIDILQLYVSHFAFLQMNHERNKPCKGD